MDFSEPSLLCHFSKFWNFGDASVIRPFCATFVTLCHFSCCVEKAKNAIFNSQSYYYTHSKAFQMNNDKYIRSVRLDNKINERLIKICEHLGVSVNSYITSEIGRSISRDEVSYNINKDNKTK